MGDAPSPPLEWPQQLPPLLRDEPRDDLLGEEPVEDPAGQGEFFFAVRRPFRGFLLELLGRFGECHLFFEDGQVSVQQVLQHELEIGVLGSARSRCVGPPVGAPHPGSRHASLLALEQGHARLSEDRAGEVCYLMDVNQRANAETERKPPCRRRFPVRVHGEPGGWDEGGSSKWNGDAPAEASFPPARQEPRTPVCSLMSRGLR